MLDYLKEIYFSLNMIPGKGSTDSDINLEGSIACDVCDEVCKPFSFNVKCDKTACNDASEQEFQTFPKRVYCSQCVEEFSKTEPMHVFVPLRSFSKD